MAANWEETPDLQRDTELQHIQHDEMLDPVDQELFLEGRYFIQKGSMAWRRLFLKTIMFINARSNSRIMTTLSLV
eukprot:74828-Pyramimonas_sp.AAC.1